MQTEIFELENGVRLVCQKIPHVDSVAVNVMLGVGSRFEDDYNNGISHMLEHMAFKGTEKRSALKIAEEFDSLGGYLNAYTSRETTSYHAKLMKHHWKYGLEVLSDILINSTLPQDELDKEKSVIVQEILEARDNPEDVIFDLFQEVAYPDQPIGRNILGTEEIVNRITRDELSHRLIESNHPENIVVAVTGNIDINETLDEVSKYFNYKPINGRAKNSIAQYEGGVRLQDEDYEQIHVNIGFDGQNHTDNDYYAGQIVATILGGGMSSRLFQEIREKRALAYHIGTFTFAYADSGLFGVNASTSQENLRELVDVTFDELCKSVEDMTEEEIERAKIQLISNIAMSSESTSHCAEEAAKSLFTHGRFITNSEIFEQIRKVTKEDALRTAKKILSSKMTFAAVGNINGTRPNIPERLF